jgi:hemoglobin
MMPVKEPYSPSPSDSPYARIGGSDAVRALVERFYDAMERLEPELTRLHRLDEHGRVSRESRDRFALFLIGWLGGPQDYVAQHGHPRLRMRHASVAVDERMRDAWMRSMRVALEESSVPEPLRVWLDVRLGEVADFMKNRA